jgi:hypothetical protein
MAHKDEGLPVAIANQGGLVTALAVLVLGLSSGGRAWIVLIQAAGAFLIASAFLKILTAAVIQGIRMKADAAPKPASDDVDDTVQMITQIADHAEPMERMAS